MKSFCTETLFFMQLSLDGNFVRVCSVVFAILSDAAYQLKVFSVISPVGYKGEAPGKICISRYFWIFEYRWVSV